MPKVYPVEFRAMVIGAVQAGASRRATADRYQLGVSTVVKWVQLWEQEKRIRPKPIGGSVSPLEDYAELLEEIIATQPDLTLREMVLRLIEAGLNTSITSVWRYLRRREGGAGKLSAGTHSADKASRRKTLYPVREKRPDRVRKRCAMRKPDPKPRPKSHATKTFAAKTYATKSYAKPQAKASAARRQRRGASRKRR